MVRKNMVVEKTVNYIEAHLDEEISLDKIAKDLNYSKFYLARVFVKETGKTIYKYVQGRRLTLAARELVKPKSPSWKSLMEHSINRNRHLLRRFISCTSVRLRNLEITAFFIPGNLGFI